MAAVLGSFQAHAVVLALDDFNYSAGELQGANGGSGFSGAWGTQNTVANDGLPFTGVTTPGLSYYDPVSGITLSDSGNAAEFKAYANPPGSTLNLQNRGRRDLTTIADQGTLFVSFLMRQTSGALGANDNAFLWLGSVGTSATTTARIGFYGQAAGDEFGIQLSNGSTFSAARTGGQAALGGDGTLFVARLSKIGNSAASDPYDQLELWVNPVLDSATFAATSPTVLTLASGGLASFNRIGFGSGTLDASPTDIFEFDRIRLGTEIGDVVRLPEPPPQVIPEASTYLGAGVAVLLGGGVYLRRRNRAVAAPATTASV